MDKLLLVIVIVLGIIAVAQIARIYELAAALRNRREEEISDADNKLNANLMLVFMVAFFAFFVWQMIVYGKELLPVAASEQGAVIDQLFNINWIILITAFILVNFLLFFFSWKYVYNKDRKAYFFAHNNKLELVWTVIPSIVLAFIIIYGLRTWNNIMDDPSEDSITIEVYARQFDWTIRYTGGDGELGYADYTLISGTNPLGLITQATITEKVEEIDAEMATILERLNTEVLPDSEVERLNTKRASLARQRSKILNFNEKESIDYSIANDDKIVKGEFHVPVGKEINFVLRSQDVIHSFYLPHFRAQMNTVPGMTTRFTMTPTITTDSMRTITGDDNFDYILLCNKICGTSHYNMQAKIVVESEREYNEWLSNVKPFATADPASMTQELGEEEESEKFAETNE